MSLFPNTGTKRRTVYTLLLVWFFALGSGWANACLLHVPRDELAGVLGLIRRALKPAGTFYASYKTGDGAGRDTLNRYYNYPSPDWLRGHRGVDLAGAPGQPVYAAGAATVVHSPSTRRLSFE